jgi:hypothetical protein
MILPQEILQKIFSLVSIYPGPRGLYPLLTVNRTWSAVAFHELYLNPFLSSLNTWIMFSQLFTSRSPNGKELTYLSLTASSLAHVFLKTPGDAVTGLLNQFIDFGFGRILRFRKCTLDKLYSISL